MASRNTHEMDIRLDDRLNDQLRAELAYVLNGELELCQDLLGHIRFETALLQQRDHDAFIRHIETKNETLANLRDLEFQRQSVLQGAKWNTADQSFGSFLNICEKDPTLAVLARNLRTAAAECTRENQALGRMINMQSRFFEFMMKQLMPSRTQNLTYQADGNKFSGSETRKLVTI
jgi:flagellar biosynthesis/type III secretory pathway chaperone